MSKPEWFDEEEAASFIGMSVAFLQKSRASGTSGPAYHKLGYAVRYSRDDLDAWLAERRVNPTPKIIVRDVMTMDHAPSAVSRRRS